LGTLLVDKALAGGSDPFEEEITKIFHDKIVDIELVDSGVLF